MDVIDSIETGVICEVLGNNNNNGTTTTVLSKRGSHSGGSITVKTVRAPVQQQFIVGISESTAQTFSLKQEPGVSSNPNNGAGMPALLTATDTSNTKLLLAADDTATTPGTIIVSGGQLYLLGDNPAMNIICTSNNSTTTTTTTSNTIISSSISNSSYLVPRPIIKAPMTSVITSDCLHGVLGGTTLGGGRISKRRVVHNEVERRRRDKINNWISKLAKILPNCTESQLKNVNIMTSKAGILEKACDHINELQRDKNALTDKLRKQLRQQKELLLLREQNNELKNENALLRQRMN